LSKNNISPKESTSVSVVIENIGKLEGDEVVQLYIKDRLASVARPVMELKAFQRIHLIPKEKKEVTFLLTPEMLSMLNNEMCRIVEPGTFKLMIGSSSKDIKQVAELRVK